MEVKRSLSVLGIVREIISPCGYDFPLPDAPLRVCRATCRSLRMNMRISISRTPERWLCKSVLGEIEKSRKRYKLELENSTSFPHLN